MTSRGAPDGSFDDLYRRAYGAVVGALILAGAGDRAEDVAQEAFARTLARWKTVSKGTNPEGYAFVTAFRLLRRGDPPQAVRPPVERAPAGDMATLAALADAVNHLPMRQRQVIALTVNGRCSADDAARILGVRPATARVHLHRARQALHAALCDSYGVADAKSPVRPPERSAG